MTEDEIKELSKAIITIGNYTCCDIEYIIQYLSGYFISKEDAFRIKDCICYDGIHYDLI